MTSRDFLERLQKRARRSGVRVNGDLASRLEVYYRLLALWNEKINLAGPDLRDPKPEILDRLLIEPLVAAGHVSGAWSALTMIDIGSGGGSPAIPMALALSPTRLHLVESKTRKSVFLREAVRSLALSGAHVFTSRYEALLMQPSLHEAHQLLTVRAVRVDPKHLMSLQAFLKPGGKILLFRGQSGAELTNPMPPLSVSATHGLNDSGSSRLVVIEKRMNRDVVPRGTVTT